jgi:hypothetical protein
LRIQEKVQGLYRKTGSRRHGIRPDAEGAESLSGITMPPCRDFRGAGCVKLESQSPRPLAADPEGDNVVNDRSGNRTR